MRTGTLEIANKLLNRLIKGDQRALKKLFDQYYAQAFETACLYCTYEDAQEVVSDVFAKLWNNRASLKDISNFKGYLFIAVKHQCLNYLRKKTIDVKSIEHVFDKDFHKTTTPHDEMEWMELSVEVDEAIDNLPPKCREAFRLVREEGLKYKEAAKALSISENTLDVHLKKATRRIMEVVKSYGKLSVLIFFLYFM